MGPENSPRKPLLRGPCPPGGRAAGQDGLTDNNDNNDDSNDNNDNSRERGSNSDSEHRCLCVVVR
jgi:hypothetical protein